MMHSNNPYSFFITIILTLVSLLNAANLVPETCTKIVRSDMNVDYDFCVKVLVLDRGSATATTIAQLGAISCQLGLSKTTSTSSRIAAVLKDPKFDDPSVKDGLKACSEMYLDAQKNLQDGLKAFKNGDYSTAENRAMAALNVPTACENKFAHSPLTKENSDFFQLAAISLGFTDLLRKVH